MFVGGEASLAAGALRQQQAYAVMAKSRMAAQALIIK
jgi:hypothetical protein